MRQLDPYIISIREFMEQNEVDKRKYVRSLFTILCVRTIIKIFEFYIPFIQVLAVQNKDLKKCCKKFPLI